MPRKNRPRNAGWFRKGNDSRRHELTAEERRRGGRNAVERMINDEPWLLPWLTKKIRSTASAATLAAYAKRKGKIPEREGQELPY